MIDLTGDVDANTAGMNTRTVQKASEQKTEAECTQELAVVTAAKLADEQYSNDVNTTCAGKASLFEKRQATRTEEMATISQAIDMLSAANISGHAATHLPSALQAPHVRRAALGVLRASAPRVGNATRALQFLAEKARQLSSQTLSSLASEVHAEDP